MKNNFVIFLIQIFVLAEIICCFNIKKREANNYVRGCYFTNWSQYRQDIGKYMPENYVPGLCTHIFYAFVSMNADFTLKPFEWNDDSADGVKGMYERVISLKNVQSDLKVILSFGGWKFSDENKQLLKSMASNPDNRKKFINSAVEFLKKRKFDGLDIDWEYPEDSDKSNFAQLMKEMSHVFHDSNLLLTAAVSGSPEKVDKGYDVPSLAQSLDMVNIMTYDFHGSGWEKMTGFNSPLYEFNGDKLSVSTAVEHWAAKGMPKSKIIVGMATYGRGWKLSDPNHSTVNSAGASDEAGPFTKEAGFLSYYEICDVLANGGTRNFDDKQKVPYVIKGDRWIGYDDVESLKLKLNWVKEGGYGGAFVWTLDLDDFSGHCASNHGQKYPLIQTIPDTFGGKTEVKEIKETTPPQPDTTPIPEVTTTPSKTDGPIIRETKKPDGGQFSCPSPGIFANPSSCSSFYNCGGDNVAHLTDCPPGLHFNNNAKVCDWPANANCHT